MKGEGIVNDPIGAILGVLVFEAIIAGGMDPEMVHQVVGLITRNEYKRRQAAPGIKITSKAFGVGRRYPIAAKY